MNYIVFLIALLIQLVAAYWIASNYFRLARDLRERQGVTYRVAEYAIFGAFVLTVIPFCMYFASWFGEKIGVLTPTPNSRAILLALGAATLVISLAGGWMRVRRDARKRSL